jgi:hypothetical protein
MVTANSKQSFKDGILSGADEIKVTDPDLAKWIVAAHAIKQVAWSIAIVLIGAGLYSMLASAGSTVPAAAALTGVAASVVGISGAGAMVGLGLALGGVSALNTMRNNYAITQKCDKFIVLTKVK